MQTNVETRVEHTLTVLMTESEWREVLDDPKRFFSEMRKELQDLQFATPEKGKRSKKVQTPEKHRTCPGCGKEFKRLANHVKFCAAAKSIVPAAASSFTTGTESPMDDPTASSVSGS